MIYYAIAQLENIVPTEAQLVAEKNSLIAYYAEYYMESEKLDSTSAKQKATNFVNNLGETYFYENVLFPLVENRLIQKCNVTVVDATHTSITTIIAEQNKPVTE
jgi:hypothetical protein